MIQFDVMVEADGWGERDALIASAFAATQPHIAGRLPEGAEVSIVLSDDAAIRVLNRDWRDKDAATNVLSFAANEGGGPVTPLLGDIIIARETVEQEAAEQAKSFEHHLTHMLIHGLLHLVGYDHEVDAEAEEMEALERTVLAQMQIADPYATA